MINTYHSEKETWVDIDQGTPEEIHDLMDTYKIHPFVGKELTSATRKPRIEFHDGYIYCILHFPVFKHSHAKDKNQEVDFIIGKNLLITARYDTIDALHKYAKTLEVKEILSNKTPDTRTHRIFLDMLRELYSAVFEELAYIEDLTESITKKIFTGKEKEMVVSISEVVRTLLDFKKVTDLHRDVLLSLRDNGEEIFGKDFHQNMESIILDYQKINSTIKSNLDMLHELRDTNNSMLTTKENETVKQLTVMGFIILPLNLIAVIFSMRTEGMPLISNPNAFLVVMLIMSASIVLTLGYAHYKKWM